MITHMHVSVKAGDKTDPNNSKGIVVMPVLAK